MKRKTILLLGVVILLISGCSKQEEVLIPNNTPPPDGTISDLTVESYINRIYITLLGRKPEANEFTSGTAMLRAHNFSVADRETFINSVMGESEYHQNLFDQGKAVFLGGVDTTDINDNLALFRILANDPNYQSLWPVINFEIDRLEEVLAIIPDLNAGAIGIQEVHRRFIYNYIYDQLNMGTQNFVISCFQNFLQRYPTAEELSKSELMVDGVPSSIFLQTGDSKEDFIDIFLYSNDYYEGQVRNLFEKYLYRSPSSAEMAELTLEFRNSLDFKALQRAILSLDEFAGV